MTHVEILSGKIISSRIGYFGKEEMPYGFITVETQEGKHVTLKIDAYTEYETIKIGDFVRVDVHSLGNTEILVAKYIVSANPFTIKGAATAEAV
ncbi:MAG: hypothetical protein ACFE7R_11555 [Candidatus Hodarchaeota archaeon]